MSWCPATSLGSIGVERHERRRFSGATGAVVERWVGPIFIHVLGKRATDDVFGEPGDQILIGARSIEGLNVRVDPMARTRIDAGPADAAVAAYKGGAVVRLVTVARMALYYPSYPTGDDDLLGRGPDEAVPVTSQIIAR